jgi:hypothetical protein
MDSYQYNASPDLPLGLILGLSVLGLAIALFYIICEWKVYTKAGKPGWAVIVPIYNIIVLLEIVGKPVWWILLLLIPCVNIVIMFIIYIELAKVFGQGTGFGIGLILLGFIFLPILAFGSSVYVGPATPSTT